MVCGMVIAADMKITHVVMICWMMIVISSSGAVLTDSIIVLGPVVSQYLVCVTRSISRNIIKLRDI